MNKNKINAYVIGLFVFQFGLVQPVASIVNSQLPIAISTIILLVIMIFNNNFKLKKYVVYSFLIFSIIFLVNAFIYNNDILIVLPIFLDFLVKGFSAFIIGSIATDGKELYSVFKKIALVNFIVVSIAPFVSFYDSMNYMRFGYALLPSTLMLIYDGFFSSKRQVVTKLLAILSLMLGFVYGMRGAILGIIIFVIISFYYSSRIKARNKVALISISALFGYFLVYTDYLIKFIDYLYYTVGIQTYALAKFKSMLVSGLIASSSGRDYIYDRLIVTIKDNLFFGTGIGASQEIVGGTAHNIFLQILLETGILGLIIWLAIWIICFKRYKSLISINGEGMFVIITVLISTAFGRLLISSDLWLRPEYWLLLSILLNSKYYKSQGVKDKNI